VPKHTSYVLAPVLLSFGVFGCVGAEVPDHQSLSSTATSTGDDAQPLPPSLPAASPNAYRLPWTCGHVYPVTQGNHGDICGRPGNHRGVEEFAWDFGLPMRTPVVAVRAGKITLAETPSPPGSECYQGCPGAGGADLEQQTCCAKCLFSANKVNVQHSDGVISSYSHLDQVVVTVGQKVAAGDLLGYSGTTGCSTGPHLHFQIMFGCPTGYCQSLPMTFDDAGDPACGVKAASQNACR
jgi:murein DD-endopeptidase MepM/ murein hydrolase activator NlpD